MVAETIEIKRKAELSQTISTISEILLLCSTCDCLWPWRVL